LSKGRSWTFSYCQLVFLSLLLVACSAKDFEERSSPAPVHSPPLSAAAVPALDADLIVVGAGLSGLSAAIEAADQGRTVLVLDISSVFGGHAVMSAGGMSISNTSMQQQQGIVDDPELLLADMINWGEDINVGWARYYAESSQTMIYDWAIRQGVEFEVVRQPPGNSVPRMHFPIGLGLGLIAPIMRTALNSPNIKFVWNMRAERLIANEGRIIGVQASNTRTSKVKYFYGQGVMLATGGFQSDIDRVRSFWREDLPEPGDLLAGSGWQSLGSGIDLGLQAGAELDRMGYMWVYVQGVPDPRHNEGHRGLRVHVESGNPFTEIWLDENGQRFTNECQSPKYTLADILATDAKSHWMVFDAKTKPLVSVAGSGWTPEKVEAEIFSNSELVKVADSLPALAQLMGLGASELDASIQRYNRFVSEREDADFQRFGSAVAKGGGCDSPSSLNSPPYYAIKRYPLSRKSMGGLSIDLSARVLDENEVPIPGLYAGGEVTGLAGINGKAGLEGTFLGPSLLTGRVAGRAFSEEMESQPVAILLENNRSTLTAKIGDEASQGCKSCHALESLVKLKRPGFQHFEFAHALVLERQIPCQACHGELEPHVSDSHFIEPLKFTTSCQFCHGTGGD